MYWLCGVIDVDRSSYFFLSDSNAVHLAEMFESGRSKCKVAGVVRCRKSWFLPGSINMARQ